MKRLALVFLVSLVFVNPYLRGDGNGYYAWLRSPLIDGDVDFGNEYLHADPSFREGFVDEAGRPTEAMRTASGRVENQWSIGPALLWLPFFGVAHLLALAGAGTPDGYSPVYLWAVAIGSALYGFAAIALGADLARRFGLARTATGAAIAVLCASSLPVYMYLLPFHVHACAAFATGLFFWFGLGRDLAWRPRAWAAWGAMGGLMVIVYYVHAVLLVAVVWQLAARGQVRERLGAAGAFAAGMLPFVALHLASRYALYGSMFTTGYRDEFFWTSPRLIATAFSPEHGLFLWTPVIALAAAGLVALARRHGPARAMLLSWGVLFFVIACYQNWHGQSSFGNRFFVSLTSVFVLGAAAALTAIAARSRAAAAAAVAVLALWNAGFVFQWGLNIVPSRGPVSFAQVARNQVTLVPRRVAGTALGYFRDRRAFTKDVETGDIKEREQYRLRR
ncbi:MAG: hypothetical protein M3R55_06135 [Acidobacteriota bacterium]|nr:hypothetical protein [Acidobacteriota bacterium]